MFVLPPPDGSELDLVVVFAMEVWVCLGRCLCFVSPHHFR